MFQNSDLDFDQDHPPELPEDITTDDMAIWRERIDALDEAIIELFNKRAFCAHMIGKIKRELEMPVYVPTREEEVLDNVVSSNGGPLPDDAIRRLYERIIDETRSLERRLNQQK